MGFSFQRFVLPCKKKKKKKKKKKNFLCFIILFFRIILDFSENEIN